MAFSRGWGWMPVGVSEFEPSPTGCRSGWPWPGLCCTTHLILLMDEPESGLDQGALERMESTDGDEILVVGAPW